MKKTDEESKLYQCLPFVNLVLSLLIVMHHSCTIDVSYNANVRNFVWCIQRYIYNLSECAVPVFFYISGMLFYRNYDNKMEQYKKK